MGHIKRNVQKHVALIEAVVSNRADLVIFPELSLTGYEPNLANDLATDANDTRLDVFQERSNLYNIVIGVGLPTRCQTGVRISMILFRPHSERLTYDKQQLHADELPFFAKGEQQLIFPVHGHVVAPAICYESLQESHADAAAESGADIYMASVAKPQRNVIKAYEHYPRMAKKYSMVVLMANFVGPADNFVCAGQSAVWNESGQLIASTDDRSEGLVIFDTSTQTGVTVMM